MTRDELTRASAVAARAAAAEAKLVKAEGTVPAGGRGLTGRVGCVCMWPWEGEGGRCVGCNYVAFICLSMARVCVCRWELCRMGREQCVLEGEAGGKQQRRLTFIHNTYTPTSIGSHISCSNFLPPTPSHMHSPGHSFSTCLFRSVYPPPPLPGQHLEEVKFLNGTISRLKDKLAAAEKDVMVAHMIKVQGVCVWGGGGPARGGGCSCIKRLSSNRESKKKREKRGRKSVSKKICLEFVCWCGAGGITA